MVWSFETKEECQYQIRKVGRKVGKKMFIELHRVDYKELRRLKSRKKEIWKEISMKEQNYEYDKKQILYEAIIW